MEKLYLWVEEATGLNPTVASSLANTLLVIIVFTILNKIIGRIIVKRTEDVFLRYRWRKTLDYISFSFGLFVILSIWIEEFKSLLTFFGLLSAGIAIALKDPLTNLAGWLFILWRKPFIVGDRIQIGNHAGDVIDVRIFQFTIIEIGNWVDADQSTGRMMHIPNAKVFTEAQANYTSGFNYIWHEIGIMVTFESDWKKAKDILTNIVSENAEHISKAAEKKIKQASEKYMIFYRNLSPIVYTSVKDSGVMLTMRFLCDPRKRRGTSQVIWENILIAFAQCKDINFAYPTQRFYNNMTEGKPGTIPPNPA